MVLNVLARGIGIEIPSGAPPRSGFDPLDRAHIVPETCCVAE